MRLPRDLTGAQLIRALAKLGYKATRQTGSHVRLTCDASNQSAVVESRKVLDVQWQKVAASFPQQVPRPPNWGGFVLSPTRLEFWQGRASRLHDRFGYTKQSDGAWLIERLSP